MREFTLGDEGSDMGRQGMNTLIGELADIGKELIPEMLEMLLRLDSSASCIKGKLGHPLTLWGDGPIVNERLEPLPSNIILSCFQPVWQSSASLESMLRASR